LTANKKGIGLILRRLAASRCAILITLLRFTLIRLAPESGCNVVPGQTRICADLFAACLSMQIGARLATIADPGRSLATFSTVPPSVIRPK